MEHVQIGNLAAIDDGRTGREQVQPCDVIAMRVDSDRTWDATITRCPDWQLFQLSPWMRFLEQTQPVERRLYAIQQGSDVVGYFVGMTRRVGPLRILGAPLPGWTTPYLGPAWVRAIDAGEFLQALTRRLRKDRIWHVELCHPDLTGSVAAAAGFQCTVEPTYVADILPDPEAILGSYSKSTRKSVRRAERAGLIARFTDDPSFVDDYYEQLRKVFAKSGIEPTYPKARVRALWDALHPGGHLLATEVVHEGRRIATRLDMVGNGWLHSFGSASDPEYLSNYPNELARYHVMCAGAARGLSRYDMNGGGSYKEKFNGRLVERHRLIYSSRLLMTARQTAKAFVSLRMKFRGTRAARPAAAAAETGSDE